ncbi:MAG: HIT domain-containing protein [Actinobacteria bacterium]|nr:HIT domain-containing protein [Actinomycetota bacterium]
MFCEIVAGDVDADIVLDEPDVLAFRDITPQAPTHVLVIPKAHHRDIAALTAADPAGAATLMAAAARVAAAEELVDGFRVVLNTGSDGGQSVFHVHAHVLGGRPLAWPPG